MAIEKVDLNNLDKSDWKTYRFDEIAQKISERVDPNDTDLEVYVGLEHIDSESLHIKRFGTPDDVNGQKLKFYKGDIIFGRRRAYQRKAGIATCDGFCSAHALVLRANAEVIDPGLFPFFLHSDLFMHRAVDISVGSLSPTINWGTLKHQEFLLPPKIQQAEICELLCTLDESIEYGFLVDIRLRATLLSVREVELSSKKYQRISLERVLKEIIPGKSLNGSNTPATGNEKGVLKISAVGANGFDQLENKRLNNQEEFLPKFQIRNSDVLITRANTTELVGRVCYVEGDFPNLMLCDKTLKLILDSAQINSQYLVDILNDYESRRQIESYATGTGGAMKNITQNEIRSIKIPLPGIGEQNELAEKINGIRKSISNQFIQTRNLQSLRASILDQVF